jgi:hypothetical protein
MSDKAIHSYPKVLALGHRYIEAILDGPYHLEEKLDGSQISFMVDESYELHMRSKGAMLIVDAPEKMFANGVSAVQDRKRQLMPNWIYRGEYFNKPKHNALTYGRIPEGHIMIFDIEIAPNNFLDYEAKKSEAKRIGFECIPRIDIDITANEFLPMLKGVIARESCLGGVDVEGVVLKNYTRITPDGKFMVGKYVSEAFKETNNKNWKADNPSKKDITAQIIETLKTDARYNKAVQRLRDDGNLEASPRDIGNLIRIIQDDIVAEEAEFIKQKLFEHAIGQIKRGVCGGFPQWYKDKLITGLDIDC